MRRLLIVTLFLVWLVSLVSAQNQELVIWTQYDLSNTEDANAVTLRNKIEAFETTTGIRVVHEQVAWDLLAPRLAIAVQAGGSVPDIVEAGSQHIPSLLSAGALTPLDDILSDSGWVSDLGDGDRLACIVDGVRYCVAHNVRGGVTYYQADAFPDGFPQTKEEWLEVAPTLSGNGNYFSTQFAGRSYGAIEIMWWPMIASNGGDLFDEEGRPAWSTPEVVEVVEFGRTLFNSGYFPELNVTGDFSDAEAPWIDGSAASFRGGSWSAIFVPGLQAAVDAGDVMMTGGVDFGGGPFVFMVSEGWVVPTGAVNTGAAAQWMDAFFEPDFIADWAAAQFGIPTLAAAYESAEFDSAFYQAVDDVLGAQGRYMQQSPHYVASLDALAVAFQELFLDPNMDIMTRLQEAEQEVLNRFW